MTRCASIARSLSCCLSGALLAGCVSAVDGLTVLASGNVGMSGVHEAVGERIGDREGRVWILFLPLGRAPDPKRLTLEILERTQADYLRNVRMRFGGFSLLAVSYDWVDIEGEPWRARGNPAPLPSAAPVPETGPLPATPGRRLGPTRLEPLPASAPLYGPDPTAGSRIAAEKSASPPAD